MSSMATQSKVLRHTRLCSMLISILLVMWSAACSSSNSPSTASPEQKAPAPKAPTMQLAPTDKVVGSVDVLKLVPESDGKPQEIVAGGWAASADASAPITTVTLLMNGKPLASTKPADTRADVAEAFGRPDFSMSGWKFEVPVGKVAPGKHKVTITATNSKGDSLALPGSSLTFN